MLDPLIRPYIDPVLDRWGRALAARGIGADTVTTIGLALGLAAAGAVYAGAFLLALLLLLAGRLADGLDGAVARAGAPSAFGGYWDIVADYVFYAAIPLAFVLHDPETNAVAGAFLIATFYVNGGSFLGYAILAERQSMRTEARGRKSFYHSAGLLEGTETIAFFVAFCLFPFAFPLLATVFGVLCLVTTGLRIRAARRDFADGD